VAPRRRHHDRAAWLEHRLQAKREGLTRPASVAEDAVMRVLRVPPELAGMRLDRFVQSQLRATSRTRSQLIISASAFSTAGEPLRKNHRLCADERVVLWRAAWEEPAAAEALPVVYEDTELLAINKPPGMAVHPTARHHHGTVTARLAVTRPGEHLTLLHRLDRETSGLLLLARTRRADRAVKQQFELRQGVLKRYLALCWGWPSWERQGCDLPLEPDRDSRYRVKMRVAAPAGGQLASTTFEVLGRRRGRDDRRYSLVRCTLHTGRQHQIRVHLAALGLPVVGDKLYGPDEELFARGADGLLASADRARLELGRHALHAAELGIDHPVDGRRLTLLAPLCPDMAELWDRLAP
jgi:23S rRNA pseudouridine1911/1915/1917 synthase